MWLLKGSGWERRGRDRVWKRVILGAGIFRSCFPGFIPLPRRQPFYSQVSDLLQTLNTKV